MTNDIPTLDPILRVTLYRLVAYPVSALDMGPMVSVVSGTNMNAMPTPWLIWYQKMSEVPDCRVMPEYPKNATLATTKPKNSMRRPSQPRPRRMPTTGIQMAVPIPRGLVQNPAVSAVQPSSVCMNNGSSTSVP